ncbi:hypothetical protein D3C72_1855380 [compost metagenome]
MDRYMIIGDDRLYHSFATELQSNGGDVERVLIKFNNYGRFVDMGVGRGVPLGSRKALGDDAYSRSRGESGRLHHMARKAKPWYSKTKRREIGKLRRILEIRFAISAMKEVKDGIAQIGNVSIHV